MRALTILTILLLLAPSLLLAGTAADTRLEGLVFAEDGLPATGYHVHLIDEEGRDSARAEVGDDGMYRLSELPAGQYALALETPDGRYARVDAPPMKLRQGQLARRDLKLTSADPAQPTGINPASSFGTWWAGLDWPARSWTIVAMVLVVGISAEALSSDESLASPFTN